MALTAILMRQKLIQSPIQAVIVYLRRRNPQKVFKSRLLVEVLGHEKLETTQVYTRLLPLDLKRQHEQFHPRG